MNINKYIFREYDIRGEVKTDFPPAVVEMLGRGYGTYISKQGAKKVALSGDIRLTTPELKRSFKEGLLSTGLDVVDIRIIPSPVN